MIKIKKIGPLVIVLGLIVMISLLAPFGSLGSAQQTSVKPARVKNEILMSLGTDTPQIDITTWRLKVDGSVQHPLSLTYDELRALPAVTVYVQLICVGGATLITEGNWTGVQLSYILTLAEVKPEAIDMVFYAADDFSSSLPVEEVQSRPDMILAYEKDGEQLTEIDGFPAIVVAPGKWGYKWTKYIVHIELVNEDYQGYWESRGYSDAADIPDYSPIPAEVFPMTSEPFLVSTTQEETVVVPELGRTISYVVIALIGLLIVGYKKRQ